MVQSHGKSGLNCSVRRATPEPSSRRRCFRLLVLSSETCAGYRLVSQGKTMDNLSTGSTDITSQIGALELGDRLASHNDGVLEAAGTTLIGPTVTYDQQTRPVCR